jgi:hypothetical protein
MELGTPPKKDHISEVSKESFTPMMKLLIYTIKQTKMNKEQSDNLKQELIERVVEEIKQDLNFNDVESLEELLRFCPTKNLIAYLPEEEWGKFEDNEDEKLTHLLFASETDEELLRELEGESDEEPTQHKK